MLRCGECGKLVEKLPEGRVRCPYCGTRLLYKARPEIIHKIKVR